MFSSVLAFFVKVKTFDDFSYICFGGPQGTFCGGIIKVRHWRWESVHYSSDIVRPFTCRLHIAEVPVDLVLSPALCL